MIRKLNPIFVPMLLAAALCLTLAGAARAQLLGEDEVASFDVSNGDSIVRIVNPSFTAATEDSGGNPSGGLLCAMIYVFDSNEELQECCGCPVTNHGLRTLSVQNNLANNTVSGSPISTGVIEIVTSTANHPFVSSRSAQSVCNPAIAPNLTEGLFSSMIETVTSGNNASVSDKDFEDFAPNQSAINDDVNLCSIVVHRNGSGAGRCTCGTGDDTAAVPHSRSRN